MVPYQLRLTWILEYRLRKERTGYNNILELSYYLGVKLLGRGKSVKENNVDEFSRITE